MSCLINPTKGPKPRREEEAANFNIWEAGTIKYSAVLLLMLDSEDLM